MILQPTTYDRQSDAARSVNLAVACSREVATHSMKLPIRPNIPFFVVKLQTKGGKFTATYFKRLLNIRKDHVFDVVEVCRLRRVARSRRAGRELHNTEGIARIIPKN